MSSIASKCREIRSDVLIIGTGLAGLRAAIEARRYGADVLLVDKSVIGLNSNSAFSGGGFLAALPGILSHSVNTCEEHFQYTVKEGKFLSDQRLVEILCVEAPSRVCELRDFGVKEHLDLYLHHKYPSGKGFVTPLIETLEKVGAKTMSGVVVTDLVKEKNVVTGAVGFNLYSKDFLMLSAKSVILASGGSGEVYERNDTTRNSTGDGFAAAYRLGVELLNMEFMQFNPMLIAEPSLPTMRIPVSKARGSGVLRNRLGEDFLRNYVPQRGLPQNPFPNHIASAMAMEVHQGRGDKGSVLFDLTCVHEEQWNADEGSKWTHDVLLGGFDCTAKLVHLFPGAHTNLGGVKINEKCETDIEGLYAAGEVSAGIHGASRLAGNALSECLVFGARAGKYAALHAKFVEMHPFSREQVSQSKEEIGDFLTRPPSAGAHPEDVKKMVKQLMWTKAGLLRNESNLKAAVDELDKIRREVLPKLFARTVRDLRDAFEVLNMVTVSEMIVRSALIRTETRGTHYRLDFPQIDDKNWLRNTTLKMTNKTMALASTSPVITRLYPQQDGE